MNPELLAAVKERQQLGHSKESIVAALEAAGYNRETIEQVYAEAASEQERSDIPLADGATGAQFAPSSGDMPGAWTLFTAGFAFMRSRLDLVLWLFVPSLFFVALEFYFENDASMTAGAAAVSISFAIATILVMVVYIAISIALLRVIMLAPTETTKMSDALSWAKPRILGILWVSILTSLVIFGGLLLFIIPGIIMAFYLYFAQYAFVAEEQRGLSALRRSVQLVRDNWWALAGRLLLFGILCILAFIPAGIVAGIITGLTGDASAMVGDILSEVVIQLASAAVTVVALHAGFTLYQHLATKRPVASTERYPGTLKLRVLMVLGVLFMLALGGLSLAGSQLQNAMEETAGASEQMLLLQMQLGSTMYGAEQGNFDGMCEMLLAEYGEYGEITCNDAATEWAFTFAGTDGQWCIDSTGFEKQVAAPLGEATACLAEL